MGTAARAVRLGEMCRALSPKGAPVPNGFAITAEAYRRFTAPLGLTPPLRLPLYGPGDLLSSGPRGGAAMLAAASEPREEDPMIGFLSQAPSDDPDAGVQPPGS